MIELVEAARRDHSRTIRILNERFNPGGTTDPLNMLGAAHEVLVLPEQPITVKFARTLAASTEQ